MSAWRRAAILKLPPECRSLIEHEKSPGMLWVELYIIFQRAHLDPQNTRMIQGCYEFARWCVNDSGNDVVAAAALTGFYEELPYDPHVREMMPHFLTRLQFLRLKPTICFLLDEEYAEKFASAFLRERRELDRAK